ncbi:MAG: hypothetical protein NXI23_13615 [Bacteroidetes bacterium]|jgi:hypothetical protein|nr:hypothetical protein [Bacteroidota bacterium]MDF1865022.1 hypothetical protein [Saprospiraceae bacterium]
MTLLTTYTAISWMLLGLIWVIQLVHYPAFQWIEEGRFFEFHKHHTRSISIIVAPLMVLELGLAFWLAYSECFQLLHTLPLTIVLLIWASTFFVQIPIHHKLSKGKNTDLIRRLVQTNWFRTILWTVKSFWLFLA